MRQNVARLLGLATKQTTTGAIIDDVADGAIGVARCDKYGNLWVTIAGGSAGPAAGTATWDEFATPGAATQATASRAANPIASHNTMNIAATVNAVAAQGAQLLVLRDGASGVGTIIWSQRLGPVLAGDSKSFAWTLSLKGTLNTAMTLEFTTAPAGTNFNSVSMNGFDA